MEVKEDDAEENQGHSDEDEYDSELDTLPPWSVMMEEVDRSIGTDQRTTGQTRT
jgi:hypothetical protein